MADYHLVRLVHGPGWDEGRGVREQEEWDEHAAFLDALTEEGVIVLGGPVGEGNADGALLVVDGEDEPTIRARLADDPWVGDLLTIESVQPWSVWLRATGAAPPPETLDRS